MLDLVWLIPALPLAGFLLLLVFGRRLGEPGSGWFATLACAGSFVASCIVFAGLLGEDEHERSHVLTLFEWIPAGSLRIDLGLLADPLSIAMCLFITGVGALIHLYSIGYMHGDPGFPRFFVYMNLFVFSMLMLVLGDNMLVTFLGWEGVGACSYFLISFWFSDLSNASAGKKAFITNRVGDWGFMLAIFLTFATVGTLSYPIVFEEADVGAIAPVTATAIVLLLFVGAVGKSAQIPLFVWLPDAMAGPTPVSALIHAATMVTAGVYLMVRVNPLLAESYAWAPDVIAWVGVLTALFAATIAVAQNDIKKVLAYSTISQLGYMFLAVGSGAYVAAIFHMITHAFFKALLFLGAGSVIHGLHGEQDMRRMGGLRKYLPITAATFIVGWLAIAGVPPFAGFFSKDEILLFAWDASPALWAVGLVTALLTAFYMSRQVFMVFFGEERFRQEAEEEAEEGADAAHDVDPHESPWTMTLPLGRARRAGLRRRAPEHTLHERPALPGALARAGVRGQRADHRCRHGCQGRSGGRCGDLRPHRHSPRRCCVPEAPRAGGGTRGAGPRLVRRLHHHQLHRGTGAPRVRCRRGVRPHGHRWCGQRCRQSWWPGPAAGCAALQPGFVRAYALGIAVGAIVVLGYFLTRVSS